MDRPWIAAGILLLVAGIGLGGVYDHGFRRMNGPPVLLPPWPVATTPPPRLARRVLWVLVDGLRSDALGTMPVLSKLAERGARLLASAELPSYSKPNFVAMATGVEPEASGVRLNSHRGRVGLPTVFDVVGAGRAAAVGNHSGWLPWLFPADAVWHVREEGFEAAARRAVASDRELVLTHVSWPDEAAHDHGARSPEYRAACARVDRLLGEWLRLVDPERDVVLVSSDHGHLDRGGHGGAEPEVLSTVFVLAGPGIGGGPWLGTPARTRDVAPTIAALLGLPPPAQARGRDVLGRAQAPAPAPAPAGPGGAPLEAAAAGALVAAALARLRLPWRALGAAALAPALFYALFFLGDTLSYSSSNQESVFIPRMTWNALGAIAAAVAVGWLLGVRPEHAPRAAVLAAAMMALPACWGVARLGVSGPLPALPEPWLQFFPLVAWGGLAVLSGLLALLVLALRRV